MKFYTGQHKHYCGIDLHARMMYVFVLDGAGAVLVHKNIPAGPEPLLALLAPYRDDLVVGVECMFSWYWVADLCQREGFKFILGHALYMKAIHGAKAKNDRIDAHKIAALLRGGLIPQAYVYPQRMRATRDLMRRRNYLMRKRSELLVHIQNTVTQYNLPPLGVRVARPSEREGIAQKFPDPAVRRSIELDLAVVDALDKQLLPLEREIEHMGQAHDPFSLSLLRSAPGIGTVLGLTILYEIDSIDRFPRVQEFLSYGRLVKPTQSSAGKVLGHSGRRIGNAHLKWAFSEAAVGSLRANPRAQALLKRLADRHGKAKALSILAARIARAVFYMLKHKQPFDPERFYRYDIKRKDS